MRVQLSTPNINTRRLDNPAGRCSSATYRPDPPPARIERGDGSARESGVGLLLLLLLVLRRHVVIIIAITAGALVFLGLFLQDLGLGGGDSALLRLLLLVPLALLGLLLGALALGLTLLTETDDLITLFLGQGVPPLVIESLGSDELIKVGGNRSIPS